MIDALAQRVWARDEFQQEYQELLRDGITSSLGFTHGAKPDDYADTVVPRLLQCATHLAGASRADLRMAAYRIAIASWTLYRDRFNNLPDLIRFILGRLGNFPAIGFLQGLVSARGDDLPLPLSYEVDARGFDNSVTLTQGRTLTFTDFQRQLWYTITSGTAVAVTAPTSAGKSFVLQNFLAQALTVRPHESQSVAGSLGEPLPSWGLYLVPTRALITQVSVSLMDRLRLLGGGSVQVPVITIPVAPADLEAQRGIYVLTQERLQTLLEADPELAFRLAVIDEAHSLADGARGVLLQNVIEVVRRRNADVQLLFGSPQTTNPEVFQGTFGLEQFSSVREFESPVSQNLVFVDTSTTHRSTVVVRAVVEAVEHRLGMVDLGKALVPGDAQSLAMVAWAFGREHKNLVYAGGPAACEKIADMLVQLATDEATATQPTLALNQSKRSRSPEEQETLDDLAAFIRDHVHTRYALARTVQQGIAFHYGNMPATVRKAIEDYFDQGLFSHLVCTSTLLAGVNLPAKNLFLQNPTKGQERETQRAIPVTSIEFWNLAGRAGRLGKDFEGNVFLIDYGRWQAKPLDGPKEQEVTPAVTQTVLEHGDDFLRFIRETDHGSGTNQVAENTFVKLVNESRRGTLAQSMDRVFRGARPEIRTRIEEALTEVAASLGVPLAVTERNVNVSVFRQDDMLAHLREKIIRDGADSVIPLHPLTGSDTYTSLVAIFGRIAKHFERTNSRSYVYYARLALRWMRGEPLPRLIDDAYQYKAKKAKREPSIAPVIRTVMADVEQQLRFKYVKYCSCYNDLLRYALELEGRGEDATRIPGLPLYLELGASSGTMVNLIGLGLTRATASVLADRAVDKDMTRTAVQRWLRNQDWESAGISRISLREINRIT